MARPFLLPAMLLLAGATGLQAQTDYYARVGAIGASTLLRDFIVTEEITVRQSIAPIVALGAAVPIGTGHRAGLEATISSGGFEVEEGGSEADLGTLRTGSLLLGLEGPLPASLRWRAGLGGLLYWPSEDAGIFLEGSEIRFLAGAGLDYRRPVHPKWDLMASVRYDFHRFTSDQLDRRGFSQAQGVSRLSLSVGVARGHR